MVKTNVSQYLIYPCIYDTITREKIQYLILELKRYEYISSPFF